MSRLRLGVVGCGRVVERFHLPALRAGADWSLAGVADPLAERRDWIRQAAPDTPVFEGIDALLSGAKPDAVLISTPPATHAAQACAALEAGVPVLVEKPMAVDPDDAERMVEASRASGQPLLVGFNRRFRRPYLTLRQMLRRADQDFARRVRHRLVLNAASFGSVTGHLGRDAGSGVLDDVACHQLDLLPWLFDRRLEAVRATRRKRAGGGAERWDFELRLAGGATVACVAAHDARYEEALELKLSGRSVVCHATAVIGTRLLPVAAKHRAGRLAALLHLALHKLGRTPNVTLQSFIGQLAAFVALVRDPARGDPIDGARGDAGARCVRAVAACRASLADGGSWREVA